MRPPANVFDVLDMEGARQQNRIHYQITKAVEIHVLTHLGIGTVSRRRASLQWCSAHIALNIGLIEYATFNP